MDEVLSSKNILERFSLKDRSALVTGGAQGIGRALAHALADAGAAVAVVDMDLALANVVVAEIKERNVGAQVIALKADVTNQSEVVAMVDEVVKTFGKLTIACNNAGIGQWIDAETMPYADWKRMMDVNLNSVFLCAQAEAKYMLASGYGKIINLSLIHI